MVIGIRSGRCRREPDGMAASATAITDLTTAELQSGASDPGNPDFALWGRLC
jgi:hypothetical protein